MGGSSVGFLQITVIIAVPTVIPKTRPFLLIDNSMKSQLLAVPYKQAIIQNLIDSAYTAANTKNLTVPQRWGAWYGENYG